MSKIQIINTSGGFGTRIFVDGKEIRRVRKVRFEQSVETVPEVCLV